MIQNRKKILLVCNRGGHFSQMLTLMDGLVKEFDCMIVTDKTEIAEKALQNFNTKLIHDFRFKPKLLQPFWLLKNIMQSLYVILKFKPRVVVTTGASLAIPFFLVGKIFNCQLIFIESRAKVYSKTKTGKLLEPFSDLIIVQWEEMIDIYGDKAVYWGQLI